MSVARKSEYVTSTLLALGDQEFVRARGAIAHKRRIAGRT